MGVAPSKESVEHTLQTLTSQLNQHTKRSKKSVVLIPLVESVFSAPHDPLTTQLYQVFCEPSVQFYYRKEGWGSLQRIPAKPLFETVEEFYEYMVQANEQRLFATDLDMYGAWRREVTGVSKLTKCSEAECSPKSVSDVPIGSPITTAPLRVSPECGESPLVHRQNSSPMAKRRASDVGRQRRPVHPIPCAIAFLYTKTGPSSSPANGNGGKGRNKSRGMRGRTGDGQPPAVPSDEVQRSRGADGSVMPLGLPESVTEEVIILRDRYHVVVVGFIGLVSLASGGGKPPRMFQGGRCHSMGSLSAIPTNGPLAERRARSKASSVWELCTFLSKTAGDHYLSRVMFSAATLYSELCLRAGITDPPLPEVQLSSLQVDVPFLSFLREMRLRAGLLGMEEEVLRSVFRYRFTDACLYGQLRAPMAVAACSFLARCTPTASFQTIPPVEKHHFAGFVNRFHPPPNLLDDSQLHSFRTVADGLELPESITMHYGLLIVSEGNLYRSREDAFQYVEDPEEGEVAHRQGDVLRLEPDGKWVTDATCFAEDVLLSWVKEEYLQARAAPVDSPSWASSTALAAAAPLAPLTVGRRGGASEPDVGAGGAQGLAGDWRVSRRSGADPGDLGRWGHFPDSAADGQGWSTSRAGGVTGPASGPPGPHGIGGGGSMALDERDCGSPDAALDYSRKPRCSGSESGQPTSWDRVRGSGAGSRLMERPADDYYVWHFVHDNKDYYIGVVPNFVREDRASRGARSQLDASEEVDANPFGRRSRLGQGAIDDLDNANSFNESMGSSVGASMISNLSEGAGRVRSRRGHQGGLGAASFPRASSSSMRSQSSGFTDPMLLGDEYDSTALGAFPRSPTNLGNPFLAIDSHRPRYDLLGLTPKSCTATTPALEAVEVALPLARPIARRVGDAPPRWPAEGAGPSEAQVPPTAVSHDGHLTPAAAARSSPTRAPETVYHHNPYQRGRSAAVSPSAGTAAVGADGLATTVNAAPGNGMLRDFGGNFFGQMALPGAHKAPPAPAGDHHGKVAGGRRAHDSSPPHDSASASLEKSGPKASSRPSGTASTLKNKIHGLLGSHARQGPAPGPAPVPPAGASRNGNSPTRRVQRTSLTYSYARTQRASMSRYAGSCDKRSAGVESVSGVSPPVSSPVAGLQRRVSESRLTHVVRRGAGAASTEDPRDSGGAGPSHGAAAHEEGAGRSMESEEGAAVAGAVVVPSDPVTGRAPPILSLRHRQRMTVQLYSSSASSNSTSGSRVSWQDFSSAETRTSPISGSVSTASGTLSLLRANSSYSYGLNTYPGESVSWDAQGDHAWAHHDRFSPTMGPSVAPVHAAVPIRRANTSQAGSPSLPKPLEVSAASGADPLRLTHSYPNLARPQATVPVSPVQNAPPGSPGHLFGCGEAFTATDDASASGGNHTQEGSPWAAVPADAAPPEADASWDGAPSPTAGGPLYLSAELFDSHFPPLTSPGHVMSQPLPQRYVESLEHPPTGSFASAPTTYHPAVSPYGTTPASGADTTASTAHAALHPVHSTDSSDYYYYSHEYWTEAADLPLATP